ncbi:unnamed protein product, partial [Prorocentrum cordatum]
VDVDEADADVDAGDEGDEGDADARRRREAPGLPRAGPGGLPPLGASAMAAAPAARGGGGVADLGVLDGRLLLFGGVYSNLQALEALVAVCRDELRIPPERVIHTGDVVAYCAQPREATELLMSTGYHCLAGNCEESVSAGSHDCGCGFPEDLDSKCAEYSRNWYAHVSRPAAASSPALAQSSFRT